MEQVEFYTIVFIIYLISLMSALFALWLKWDYDKLERELHEMKKKNEEIGQALVKLQILLEKPKKDPFRP